MHNLNLCERNQYSNDTMLSFLFLYLTDYQSSFIDRDYFYLIVIEKAYQYNPHGIKSVKHELAIQVVALQEKFRSVSGYFIYLNKLNFSEKIKNVSNVIE